MNETLIKIKIIFLLLCCIALTIKSQNLIIESDNNLDTIVNTEYTDSVSSNLPNYFIFTPSLDFVEEDSLLNLPDRLLLPDSLDYFNYPVEIVIFGSLKEQLSRKGAIEIILDKLRLSDDKIVADFTKIDFINKGLPEIMYEYFLQMVDDINLYNQLNNLSAEAIRTNYEKSKENTSQYLEKLNLYILQNELKERNKEFPQILAKLDKPELLTMDELDALLSCFDMIFNSLQLSDSKLILNIGEEERNQSLNHQIIYTYFQFILDFANLDFEINKDSLQTRIEVKNEIKNKCKIDYDSLKKFKK